MQRTLPEDQGRVQHGPPPPPPGLPVLPELAEALADAADLTRVDPPGGGTEIRDAAAAHWHRRSLPVEAHEVVAAPGAPPLLFALMAAIGGDVLLPRPCPAWWAPQVRLLGGARAAYHVPTPAECGGVPDPYALLETVRRVRAEGGAPRLLVLSVPDDPTATVAPPEVVHQVCEAALAEGLFVVSDETWRDTLHRPTRTPVHRPAPRPSHRPPHHGTTGRTVLSPRPGPGTPTGPTGPGTPPLPGPVFLSAAEMFPDHVVVLSDLAGALVPTTWRVAVARLPDTAYGSALRARVLDALAALGATVPAPLAAAATYALGDPEPVVTRARAAAALHARVQHAVLHEVLAAGALARPPTAGRHLYADLDPLRDGLAARGVSDSMELEEYLSGRLGTPVPGGHRFGDPLSALRVRISTAPLLGATPEERMESLSAEEPLELPHLEQALNHLGTALAELG
ncbi:aminotransferase class I/II-fold pyridoxal phosphate-dependent enzyme [Streptomyces sp. NPDC051561]|uniref:aminotransferase class I/II-fold pyridoxal phosphate-dependent enzyme n=1 Tax=Streptomyces sp. NPDC051561 TaxID=3365658 RepID=UPI0037B0C052